VAATLRQDQRHLYFSQNTSGQKTINVSTDVDNFGIAACAQMKSLEEINKSIKDTNSDITMLNCLNYLMHAEVKLDVPSSLVEKANKTLQTMNASLDLDSVFAIFSAPIRDDIVDEVESRLKKIQETNTPRPRNVTFPQVEQDRENLLHHISDPNPDPLALAIVQIANEKGWIRINDMQQLIPIDSLKFVPLSFPGTPSPTIGFKFYSTNEVNKTIFSLPTPENSDPMRGWIRINPTLNTDERLTAFRKYKQCVKEIAGAICKTFAPGNHWELANIFSTKEGEREIKGGKCLGGMWIHRLAFMLYHIKNKLDTTGDWVLNLMEETFNGKARCGSVNLSLNLFSKNIGEQECADASKNLATKICAAEGTDFSILRFQALQICQGVLTLGIGMQFDVIEDHENETYTMYYPCRAPKTHTKDLDNGDWTIKYYTTGGLCGGLSGYLEGNKYTNYVLTADKKMLPVGKTTVPKSVTLFCTAKKVVDQPDPEPVLLRMQTYYNTFRYAEGLSPYEDRLSTRLQYCSGIRQNPLFNSNSDDDYEGDANIATLYKNLELYKNATDLLIKKVAKKPGFRTESTYAIKSTRESNSDTNDLVDVVAKWLVGPVSKTFKETRSKTNLVKLPDIVGYMRSVIIAYIFLYDICLQKLGLDGDVGSLQRNAICIFLKHVQDFLALFYSGTTKPTNYKSKTGNSVQKRLYRYTVSNAKLANILNRPFCVLPTIPAILKQHIAWYYFAAQDCQRAKESLLSNRGFILTQPLTTEESFRRKERFLSLVKNGHQKAIGIVYPCANANCLNRYHLSRDSLFFHLEKNPLCKRSESSEDINDCEEDDSEDPNNGLVDSDSGDDVSRRRRPRRKYPSTAMTPDVVAHTNAFLMNECKKASNAHVFALQQVRDGKSIYISGDGGAGKSYLARLLLKQALMIHGDWVVRKQGRVKVFGIALQGIACTNMGTMFTSIHRYLGIKDFNDVKNMTEENMRSHCEDKLRNDANLRTRLKNTEVLIIDEVGNIHEVLGRFLLMYLKLARENDMAFGGVQIIVLGQVTQMLPCDEQSFEKKDERQVSWGRNEELNGNTRHIYLATSFRSQQDEVLQQLIKKARHGKLQIEDLECLRKKGANVKSILSKSVATVDELNGITQLFYKNDDVASSNRRFIEENVKKRIIGTNQRMRKVYAKDSLGGNTNEEVESYSKESIISRVVLDTGNGTSYTFDKELDAPAFLYIYIGMPVVMTRNIWSEDLTKRFNIAKHTQGVISNYTVENNDVTTVDITLNLTSECGHPFFYKITEKRELGYRRSLMDFFVYDASDPNKWRRVTGKTQVSREMFRFNYGKNLSWSAVQGLTLNKVVVDLSANRIITYPHSKIQVAALFYVALSRVKSLDDFLLIFPEPGKAAPSVKEFLPFVNFVDKESVDFEVKWVKMATTEEDEYIIKAKDPLALMDMQNETYFQSLPDYPSARGNFMEQQQETKRMETEKEKESTLTPLFNVWDYFFLSAHYQKAVGFFLPSQDNSIVIYYDGCFQTELQKIQSCVPQTIAYQKLKVTLIDKLPYFFGGADNAPTTFKWMSEAMYYNEDGKRQIDELKEMYGICDGLRERTEKNAKVYESLFIQKELAKLSGAKQKEIMSRKEAQESNWRSENNGNEYDDESVRLCEETEAIYASEQANIAKEHRRVNTACQTLLGVRTHSEVEGAVGPVGSKRPKLNIHILRK
jgi:hypothetical protein